VKIHKNDTILVISGKDKGKKGKVRFAYPGEARIMVDGINMIKKHSKAKGMAKQAGIIEREASIHVSKVMLICNKCSHPVRVGWSVIEGKKVRTCAACHEVID